MKTSPIIYTPAGPLKICTVWDFMVEIPRRYHPNVLNELALMTKEEVSKTYLYDTHGSRGIISNSIHILKQDPIQVFTELSSSIRYFGTSSPKSSFTDLINEVVIEAIKFQSMPTHLFAIGKSQWCLAQLDDFTLYIDSEYSQVLVCSRPTCNFMIQVPPNLKIGL